MTFGPPRRASVRVASAALLVGLVAAGCTGADDSGSAGSGGGGTESAEAPDDGDQLSLLCRDSQETLIALTQELGSLRAQLGQAQNSPEQLAGLSTQVDAAGDQLLDGLRGLQASLGAAEVDDANQAAVDEMADLVAQRVEAYQAFADEAVAALASGDQARIDALVTGLIALQEQVAPVEQRQTELAVQLDAPACQAGSTAGGG